MFPEDPMVALVTVVVGIAAIYAAFQVVLATL